jgi:hypothetical protein
VDLSNAAKKTFVSKGAPMDLYSTYFVSVTTTFG